MSKKCDIEPYPGVPEHMIPTVKKVKAWLSENMKQGMEGSSKRGDFCVKVDKNPAKPQKVIIFVSTFVLALDFIMIEALHDLTKNRLDGYNLNVGAVAVDDVSVKGESLMSVDVWIFE